MNKAMVLREKTKALVPLLAGKGIQVTHRGATAYVEFNTKGIPVRVNVPYIPDNAGDDFLAAIEGFLDHEVSHVLHSDPKVIDKATKLGLKKIHNLIEDVYIERRMSEVFRGSKSNLQSMHVIFIREYTDKKVKEDPENAMGYLMVAAVRAFAGQSVFEDYMADKWGMMGDIPKIIEPYCRKVLGEIRDSEHALEIAAEINKMLKQPPEPPEPPQDKTGGKGETPEEEGEEGDSTESTEDADDKEALADPELNNDEDDTPATDGETDKSDAEDDPEPEEGEQEDSDGTGDEQEDLSGTGEEQEDDSGADTEAEGESEPEEGADTDDKPNTEEEQEPEDTHESAGEDAPAEEETEDSRSSESTEGDGGGESGDDATPEESEVPEGEPDEAEPELSEVDEVVESDAPPLAEYDLSELMEEVPDFDDAMAEVLTTEAEIAMKESDYNIYTTDFDVIEPYTSQASDAAIRAMTDKVDHMVGAIQKDLERAIAAQSRSVWSTGHRTGRLNPGALARLTTFKDDRAFRRKHVHTTKDTAVELVIDCSGSMHGHKIQSASYAAYALASVLDRIGVPCEVLGFTTKAPISIPHKELLRADAAGVEYARTESLYIPIFKGFNEKLDVKVRGRLAALQQARWLRENVDGESIAIAAYRLSQRQEERKIMIVLSDGQPACSGDFEALKYDLKNTVKKIERTGITVLGIGIQSDAPKHYYGKHVILRTVNDLPTTVVREIRDLLLK